MNFKILDGKNVSKTIKENIKLEISKLYLNQKITIAIIMIGNDESSFVYAKSKKKACDYVNINTLMYNLPYSCKEDDIIKLINTFNNSKYINGIFIEMPLPKHINKDKVLKCISTKKDLDCFHPYNFGKLAINDNFLKPCTAASVIEILKYYNIDIKSKHCVIIGRSNIIGKPLSLLLLKENATTTICHSYTKNIEDITKSADILISSVGKKNFVTSTMVKKNSIIIDIGINVSQDGKICGDVDFENVKEKVSYITPVPGGIGPITVAMFLKNCLIAYKYQNKLL